MSRTRLVMSLVLAGQRCPTSVQTPQFVISMARALLLSGRLLSPFHQSSQVFLYQCDPVSPRFPHWALRILLESVILPHARTRPCWVLRLPNRRPTVDRESWQIPSFRMLERKAI